MKMIQIKKNYKKKNIRILIEDKNEMYRSVPQEVLEFKNKHSINTKNVKN